MLYITYDGLTDPLGQSQVIPYVAGLSSKGYEFHLLSCEKKERFFQSRGFISDLLMKNNIKWYPVFYTKKPPVISTVWDMIKLFRKARHLHLNEKFSIVHCRSYIPSLVGLHLKKKYGMKFIFDMRGFWADERVDGSLWDTTKFIYRNVFKFFKQQEIEFLLQSDSVISLTENAKSEMLKWGISGLSKNKIAVIPCAADELTFSVKTEESQILAKSKLNIGKDEFVLSYIGSLGTWYLLDEMIRFFKLLKGHKANARFLFLTPEKKEDILSNAAKYALREEDFIVHFAQRRDIPSFAHASDLSIFFIKPSYSKKSSCPTKMGELLMMGIPVIANAKIGDVEEIISRTRSGVCLPEFTDHAFNEAISAIDRLIELRPVEIRESSMNYFNLEQGVNNYFTVYNALAPSLDVTH